MIFENMTDTTILIEDAAVPIRAGERFYVSERWLGKSAQALNTNGSGIAVSVQNMIELGWIKEIKAIQKDGKGWDQIADKGWVTEPAKEPKKKRKKRRVVTQAEVPTEKKKVVDVDRWDFIP